MNRSFGRRLRLLLATSALAAGLLAGPTGAPTPAQAQTPDYLQPGPHRVEVQQEAVNTYYFPADLSVGAPHPVILWGNGTITAPSWYDGLLRHMASHGFIVAAANTSNAGSGQEMLNGLDELTAWNQQSGNDFYQKVDLEHVGTTGHSQGAAGAVRAAADPRVDTMFPIEGGASNVTERPDSALYLAGEGDPFNTSMRTAFDAASIPAAYAEVAGASHLTPLGSGGTFRAGAAAWALFQLRGDTTARAQFVGGDCGLCASDAWSEYAANEMLGSAGGEDPAPPPPETPETPETPDNGSWWDRLWDWLFGPNS
jgi:Chlorophyllase enzyme